MELDIKAFARKPASERVEWFRFKQDFEVQLTFAPAKEQAEFLGTVGSMKRGNLKIDDAKSRDYWCSHATDWRGLTKGGVPQPFDMGDLRDYYDLDVDFRIWLVERCQDIDGFLGTTQAA